MRKLIAFLVILFITGIFTSCKQYESCPAYKHEISTSDFIKKITSTISFNNIF